MATTAGPYNWGSASPPTRHSPLPDQALPAYPDRPIRPLPKRRLRDRLSAEHQDALALPPQAPNSSPIFGGYPYTHASERDRPERRPLRAGSGSDNCECGHDHHSDGGDSEEDDEEERQRTMQFGPESLQMTRRDGDYYGNGKAAARADWDSKPAPPGSTASSADGYESFENTNNKKKRKIPQSSTGGDHGHQSTLSADMANMGISQQRDGEFGAPTSEEGNYASHTAYTYGHQTVSSSPSGSNSARARPGRSGRGSLDRRPLSASTNGLNAARGHGRFSASPKTGMSPLCGPDVMACGLFGSSNGDRRAKGTDEHSDERALLEGLRATILAFEEALALQESLIQCSRYCESVGTESFRSPQYSGEPGIISTAIANAAQQQRSTTPPNGVESVSLLQQASKSPPQKTDFTFTPDGGGNRPVWPGQHAGMPPAGMYNNPPPPGGNPNPGHRRSVPQGTQTSPNTNGVPQMPPPPQGQQPPAQVGAPPPKQKKPRRPGRVYILAARQRRLQQEYQNYHHPPQKQDIWICEFCEYETIFGTPPTALIRQYEIKDRKIRKELAERRRLLEKAKMKGRKGKKGNNKGKNNANHHAQQQPPPANHQQRYDPPVDEQLGEEDYYEDDEEYDYDDGELPPVVETTLHQGPLPNTAAGATGRDYAGGGNGLR